MTLGMRAMVQNDIVLDGVAVDRQRLLGCPGDGMRVAQDALMHGRLGLAALSLGGMKRAAQLMLRYARRRDILTGRLIEHPLTRFRLGNLVSGIVALESLVRETACRLDARAKVPEEVFLVCKIVGPDLLWRAADDLIQLLGGRGYIEPNLAPGLLDDARLFRIFEGPTETLAAHLGARILQEPSVLAGWIVETLGATRPAAAIREAMDEALANRRKSGDDAGFAMGALHIHLGFVAAYAVLEAVSGRVADSRQKERAVVWAREGLEHAISSLRRFGLRIEDLQAPERLARDISGFDAEIGDVEQMLPGPDMAMDPLLRIAEPIRPNESPARSGVVDAAIEHRLRAMVARRLKVSPESIDRTRPLTAYGLDSLLAAELAMDVSESESVVLSEAAMFEHPTLAALVSRIERLQGPEHRGGGAA
jgi:acyl carrier protein